MVKSLPGGDRVWAQLHTKAEGVGSKNLAVQNPLNDQQMRRNRRIVFKWSRCIMPGPIIRPFPEIPRPNPPDPEDNPNVVFAGDRFKMKILSGVSAGELVGGFSYHFLIVDVVNKRSCEYNYVGVIGTIGVPPFTESGESEFSNEFSTLKHIQVDQFSSRNCDHDSGSIGLVSGMRFNFGQGDDADLRTGGPVNIFAGPSKSLGVETGSGGLGKIPGTVAVFKG